MLCIVDNANTYRRSRHHSATIFSSAGGSLKSFTGAVTGQTVEDTASDSVSSIAAVVIAVVATPQRVPTANRKLSIDTLLLSGTISIGKCFLFERAVLTQYVPLSSKSPSSSTLV